MHKSVDQVHQRTVERGVHKDVINEGYKAGYTTEISGSLLLFISVPAFSHITQHTHIIYHKQHIAMIQTNCIYWMTDCDEEHDCSHCNRYTLPNEDLDEIYEQKLQHHRDEIEQLYANYLNNVKEN